MGLSEKVITPVVFVSFLIWNVSANRTTAEAQNSSALEPIIPTFELPSNLTLRKCQCQANQVSNGSNCVDLETSINVADAASGIELPFSTSDFSNVTVGDVQCAPGLMNGTFVNYSDHMLLLTTGELAWNSVQMDIQDYCVEYLPTGWVAQVCLEPPPVPRCCPPDHVLGPEDTCVEGSSSSSVSFAPPLTLDSQVMTEVEVENGEVKNITCSGLAVKRRVTLGSDEGNLTYNPVQAMLTYKLPSYTPYVEPEEDYCVGVEESAEGSLQYVAKFCFVDLKEEYRHACRNTTCVRKCCQARQFLWDGNCVPLYEKDAAWKPVFYDHITLQPEAKAPENLVMAYGLPLCVSFYELQPDLHKYDKRYLLRDGSLYSPFSEEVPPGSYCLDATLDEKGIMGNIAIVCASGEQSEWNGTLELLKVDYKVMTEVKPVSLDVILLRVFFVFFAVTIAGYLGVSGL